MRFQSKEATPRTTASRPHYPQVIGLGLLLGATACGGQALEDAQTLGQGGQAQASNHGGGGWASAGPHSPGAGTGGDFEPGPPYDAGPAPGDAAEDPTDSAVDAASEAQTTPPPDGDSPEPFDAGPAPVPEDGFAGSPYEGKSSDRSHQSYR